MNKNRKVQTMGSGSKNNATHDSSLVVVASVSSTSNATTTKLTNHALLTTLLLLILVACGTEQGGAPEQGPGAEETTFVQGYTPPEEPPPPPEPAEAPPLEEEPAGRVVEVGGGPEGMVADPETNLVAVGLRDPDVLALLDGESGERVREVDLPESPRHLQLTAPGGPVLVPAERSDSLAQVTLPDGDVSDETPVGAFPHDATAAPNGRIFVANEFGDTVSVVEDGEEIRTLEAPQQPGNVTATGDGLVGVIGVRGLALEVYDAETLESFGRIDAGQGPTHVVAGPDGRFYVADTRGGEILVYEARPEPGRVASAPLPEGYPYGLAMDAEREQLWVTLTAENSLVRFDISGATPREMDRYPTVRQPNTVAVNHETGRVYVAGRDGEVQIIDS